ncbi:hypothetical protein NQ176_g208 [Zarea fungicola]|uniref:Uncharacterized protein n=1 Tax=Zarea fungicola TaxID=93591 RepID=A0ACC1NZ40_9HYPO|nr:hypothetical protein NQ176_g208 [Lecanicillium fungicola]
MQLSLITLLGAIAAQAHAWTLQAYEKSSGDSNCDAGFLDVDEVINKSGTEPLECFATSGVKNIQSVKWNSDGDFFVCFYNSRDCNQAAAVGTFPEGDFGCQATNFNAASGFVSLLYFSVKASSEGTC